MAKKTIKKQNASNILLSPGSSRRKVAWNRLRNMGNDRGLTQDQISRYLENQIKEQYQKVRKEGALTYDKVQRYLDYLAKVASQTLSRSQMDQKKMETFTKRVEPVLVDIASKNSISESDIEAHTNEVKKQAEAHITGKSLPQTEVSPIQIELEEPGELEEPADAEETPGETDVSRETEETPNLEILLGKEIIPMGFEQGAPRITVEEFLKFPLAKNEEGPDQDTWFKDHQKYLQLALKNGCVSQEDFDNIVKAFAAPPKSKYRKYFNIFPDNEYEDTVLMMLFSQWRNKTLDRFLIEEE